MNLFKITETFLDFPDTESIAVMAFFEGCEHDCPNCQNKELQQRTQANETTWQEVFGAIESRCIRNETDKVVLTGGDPYYMADTENDMLYLIDALEDSGFIVCVYTGYVVEHIEKIYSELDGCLRKPTYLKCGKYIEALKDPNMGKTDERFVLASGNQRFYERGEDNMFKQISDGNVLEFD